MEDSPRMWGPPVGPPVCCGNTMVNKTLTQAVASIILYYMNVADMC